MNRKPRQLRVSTDEINDRIAQVVDGGDAARADALDGLVRVREVRAAVHEREHARLAEKLGAKHPRVAALSARIAADPVVIAELGAEANRARTEPVLVNDQGWLVHGFVRYADGTPAPGMTVALYDARGRRAVQFGYACTDAGGYFRLSPEQVPQQGEPLSLRVSDDKGGHVNDPRTLTPARGQFAYREIILGSDGMGTCRPPEDEPGGGAGGRIERDDWVVLGQVTDAEGNPLAGVTVSLFDKDLIFDDRLGQVDTDAKGDYMLRYHTEDFRDLIEKKPDLFVVVIGKDGKAIHTQPAELRREAGRTEVLNLQVGVKKGESGKKRDR